jgi:hypothetical protein
VNNILVIVHPQEADEDGPLFEGAVAASPKRGPLRAREMIPRGWGGVFQRRFLPAFEVYPNDFDVQKEIAQSGITHVALLTGDCHQADPFYFGQGQQVNGMSILCWYDEKRDLYSFFHCAKCGTIILTWLAMKQETWSADNSGPTKEARTIH